MPLTSSPWFFLPSPGPSRFLSFFPSCCSKTEQPGRGVINELHLWAAGGGWTTGARKQNTIIIGRISVHLFICLSDSGGTGKGQQDGLGPSPTGHRKSRRRAQLGNSGHRRAPVKGNKGFSGSSRRKRQKWGQPWKLSIPGRSSELSKGERRREAT